MNWDEIEDLARLLSIAQNKNNLNRKAGDRSVATTYGYYTEWWFNYGWSVGGDCLQDLTGEGTWAYGLADWSRKLQSNRKTHSIRLTKTAKSTISA